MNEELARFVRKGRASSFRIEVEQILERGERPSLEGSTFQKVDLQGFDFENIDMTNVEFDRCSFTDVRFVQCTLEGTYINATAFNGCFVSECVGEGFAVDACTITRTEIGQMTLPMVEWSDTQFIECTIGPLTLPEGLLERITVRDGEFKGIEINEGTLNHVTLREITSSDQLILSDCEVSHSYVVHLSLIHI